MATRCKTVEYVFPSNATTLAADTQRHLSTLEIYLPESSKVCRSLTLELGCTDDISSGSSASSIKMELALIPQDPSEIEVIETLTSTNESSVYHVSRDVTE